MGTANWWTPRPLRQWHLRRNLAPDRDDHPDRYPRVELEGYPVGVAAAGGGG
ncbi:MAG TPA: hypothetical protein VNG12_05145 [Acidimicrobiales bacterium]|nr:hypothetical protein [Acidimicrobiales bacterium]